jgi:hypothetical protein
VAQFYTQVLGLLEQRRPPGWVALASGADVFASIPLLADAGIAKQLGRLPQDQQHLHADVLCR